jgi:hypothetical protein
MLLASLRLGFLLTTLVVSLQLAAAPRFWTLTGVRFADHIGASSWGGVVSGSFSYDDATHTIAQWNVRVSQVEGGQWFPGFTYVPANSITTGSDQRTLYFAASASRGLLITPIAPLDGSNATVPLDLPGPPCPGALESGGEWDTYRCIAAGSLTLTPLAPPVVLVQVDEFYNLALRHYFITANDAEKADLDTGVHSGWKRTGESFKAYATGSSASGSINPVCRYYSDPQDYEWGGGVDSHFLSADAGECLSVFRKYANGLWTYENDNAFQINLPDKATGTCPSGTIPVYRLWNQPADSNHRYTTSAAIKADMLGAGFLAEGYGPNAVAMCAVQ